MRRWTLLGSMGGALAATVVLGALQDAGEPTLFRPSGNKDAVSLPRGEVLLFQFLQAVADSTGVTVCYKGNDAPDKVIKLSRAIDALDNKTAMTLLGENDYDLSAATYRGKQVHWVQKLLVPPRQKGRILRQGEKRDPAPAPTDIGDKAAEAAADSTTTAVGKLTMYQRESGNGARYVVTYESESRQAAEEALSLLKAHQRSRATSTAR